MYASHVACDMCIIPYVTMFHSMELHPTIMQTVVDAIAQLQHSRHPIRTLISVHTSAWHIGGQALPRDVVEARGKSFAVRMCHG